MFKACYARAAFKACQLLAPPTTMATIHKHAATKATTLRSGYALKRLLNINVSFNMSVPLLAQLKTTFDKTHLPVREHAMLQDLLENKGDDLTQLN